MEDNWKEQVRQDIIVALDKFLELSESGGWGIKYHNPAIGLHEDGTVIRNKEEVEAVDFYIQFVFKAPLKIVGE